MKPTGLMQLDDKLASIRYTPQLASSLCRFCVCTNDSTSIIIQYSRDYLDGKANDLPPWHPHIKISLYVTHAICDRKKITAIDYVCQIYHRDDKSFYYIETLHIYNTKKYAHQLIHFAAFLGKPVKFCNVYIFDDKLIHILK